MFILRSACRCSRCEVALGIQRNRSDRPEIRPDVGFPLRNKILRIAQTDAVLERKLLRAVTGNQHVTAFFENRSGKTDRIANAFHGNNGAGLERSAFHKDGVELHLSVTIEIRSETGVEYRIVFEFDDRLLAGVDCGTAALQHLPSSIKRSPHSVFTGFPEILRNIPCSSVNGQRNIAHPMSIWE